MLQLLSCFFAHLLILECPDHHQNFLSFSLYYPGPCPQISSQSIRNVLSNVVPKQTDKERKQTNRQTNATKNITSFSNEVKKKQKTDSLALLKTRVTIYCYNGLHALMHIVMLV